MSNAQNTPASKTKVETPKSASNAPKIEPTTPKAEALGTLKPTPVIEPSPEERAKIERLKIMTQVEDTLFEIDKLQKLRSSYVKLDNARTQLKDFEFGLDEDAYGTALKIVDSKNRTFETRNPRLIEALIKALMEILDGKIDEMSKQLTCVNISR